MTRPTDIPSVAELLHRISQLRQEQNQDHAAFEARQRERASQLQQLEHELYLRGRGIDTERFVRGRDLFQISGTREGLLPELARQAMEDLITDAPKLVTVTFGFKDFAHWKSQRSDHPYGSGPTHGHIVAQLGLSHAARRNPELLREQLDDALYFLNAMANGAHPRLAPAHAEGAGR